MPVRTREGSDSLEDDIIQVIGVGWVVSLVIVYVLEEISKDLVGTCRWKVPQVISKRARPFGYG
jgi:hypothetical protein